MHLVDLHTPLRVQNVKNPFSNEIHHASVTYKYISLYLEIIIQNDSDF